MMEPRVTHRRSKLRIIGIPILLVATFVASGGQVRAADRHFVLPDGRQILLTRSKTELAVTFKTFEEVEPCKRNLAAKGLGRIEDFPGARRSHIKILRTSDTSKGRSRAVLADPAIKEVRPVYRMQGVSEPFLSSGSIAIKLDSRLSEQERSALWSQYRVSVIEAVDGLDDVFRVKPLDDLEDEVLRAEALASDDRTLWAHPDFRKRNIRRQLIPNDEFFGSQWHLSNTGQSGGKPGADISVEEAWTMAQGQDILIGMYDDACDVDHEDLRENFSEPGHDPTVESNDPGFEDPRPKQFGDNHGTLVMGLAVARANDVGVRGVSFLSRFTVSRGLDELTTFSEDASVYTFARQQQVDVHINSWGYARGTPNPPIVVDAIATAFRDGRDPDGNTGPIPARGMVVVFASGNGFDGVGDGLELAQGDDLSTLTTVIGVGSTTNQDTLADFSNFGADIDLLAPGGGDLGLATVDNDDQTVFVDAGFNIGGVTSFGAADLDVEGRYSKFFQGTSASCPLVAGVAALILSANPLLSATDVRLVMEHTADRISPADAAYNNITSRSLEYTHGRVNAAGAVQAAADAVLNFGLTWPERVSNVRIEGTTLFWEGTVNTREFLVIESPVDFTFPNDDPGRFPVDVDCYDTEQFGCDGPSVVFASLPSGVTVTSVVPFDEESRDGNGGCGGGCVHSLGGVAPGGAIAYAVYARSAIGRYGWGERATVGEDGGGGGNDGGPTTGFEGPKVTIQPSIVEGVSPLEVRFTGNAQRTNADIDDSRTVWDFDLDDDSTIDATTRNAVHTYVVTAGNSRTFIARLTMFDTDGNPGTAQVAIRVQGSEETVPVGDEEQTSVRILVSIPGTTGSDESSGTSPFEVLLSIDASALPGTLRSIVWDLGDGTSATSLTVPHVYMNTTDPPVTLRIPIVATIVTSDGQNTMTTTASKVISVLPGFAEVVLSDPTLPGSGTQPGSGGGAGGVCGAMGMITLAFGLIPLAYLRRRVI